MILKKKTISLIFIFWGVLTTIFGAFFTYIFTDKKKELIQQLQLLYQTQNIAQKKIEVLKHIYKLYYNLIDSHYNNDTINSLYLKPTIQCLALKANYTLNNEIYKSVKKSLKFRYKKKSKYRTASSCYYFYNGKIPHILSSKFHDFSKSFDITMEDSTKRPTIGKIINEYIDKINEYVTSIDTHKNTIENNLKELRKYIIISADSNLTNIKNVIENNVKNYNTKKISELKDEMKKENTEGKLMIQYIIINKRTDELLDNFINLLRKKEQFITGIVDKNERREFDSNDILRNDDCASEEKRRNLPEPCGRLIGTTLCKTGDKIKSFSSRVTEIITNQLNKRNELIETFGIKFKLDRNDTTLLTEFKESKDKLSTFAREIIGLRQSKKTLEEQIEKIKSKIAKQKLEKKSVGKILSIDYKANKGVINIGRKNGLFNNTIFEIYGVTKGREFVLKGIAKILKLGNDYSRILVLPMVNVEDKNFTINTGAGVAYPEFFDIITKDFTKRLTYRNIMKIYPVKDLKTEDNDILYSEIFDPQQKKVVSFAGNLHLIYTNMEATKKLTEWNFKVQNKVDINVDFVILGKDYQDSENYKIAKDLNIKLLREKDLYDLLELSYKY